ncbi:MAG: cysteine desulfurase-like protein [Rhizobiaceae bacterium]
MSFDVEKVRSAFPGLALTDNGKRRIYLDNPAGTQVPAAVGDAIRDALLFTNANLGGNFITSRQASDIHHEAHVAMADMLGAQSHEEIVIGLNMTSLTYQFSRTLARDWKAGDEIILTQMDHEGNVGPWMQAAEEKGVTIKWLPFSQDSWQIEADSLRAALSERTRLLALSHASNLTGSINRVRELVAIARQAGALVFVDSVQFAPHGFVDVQDVGCDFLACSAYKFFGPHLGVVYGRKAVLETLKPYKLRCSDNALPGRFETGTPSVELLAGLSETVNHISRLGEWAGATGSRREKIRKAFEVSIAHENPLAQQLIDGLSSIAGLRIRGITDKARLGERVPTVSFTVDGLAPVSLVKLMNEEGIFCWSGHNYAWGPVHQMGIAPSDGVVRIGIANYNTRAEIEETLESVHRNLAMLRQQR